MAMACLRLVTFLPELPERRVPALRSFMARSTFSPLLAPYFFLPPSFLAPSFLAVPALAFLPLVFFVVAMAGLLAVRWIGERCAGRGGFARHPGQVGHGDGEAARRDGLGEMELKPR